MPSIRIDLRSDTRTAPTPAMRRAMSEAEVGDEQSGDDPTVRELEATAAEIFGTEAALFLASGTMGNLVGLLTISRRGDAVIIDSISHMAISEGGGYATLAGCTLLPVETGGVMTAEHVRTQLGPVTPNSTRPGVIWTENTHNRRGGVPSGPDVIRELAGVAAEHGLKIHIDGARIFNAAVAFDVPVAELVKGADTVQVCLTKGLGAPFGSMLLGTADGITAARRQRQIVGGGMRQAGVMAAAGLIALRHGPARLAADHQRAKLLGTILEDIEGVRLGFPVATNLVFFWVDDRVIDPVAFADTVTDQGLGIGGPRPGNQFRLVTHHQLSDADIDEAGEIIVQAAEASRVGAGIA